MCFVEERLEGYCAQIGIWIFLLIPPFAFTKELSVGFMYYNFSRAHQQYNPVIVILLNLMTQILYRHEWK